MVWVKCLTSFPALAAATVPASSANPFAKTPTKVGVLLSRLSPPLPIVFHMSLILDGYYPLTGKLWYYRYVSLYITTLTGVTNGTYMVTPFAGATLTFSVAGHALAEEGKITVLQRRH